MKPNVPSFAELLEKTQTSAVHLEMRDSYGVPSEADTFASFLRGEWSEEAQRAERSSWLNLVAAATARGVVMRRARIVSEPVSDYIRYEHAGTQMNIDAGEQVRWLPRRRAFNIALPGTDFWVFDGRLVQLHNWTGTGDWHPDEPKVRTEDPSVVKLCASAFETVWERAIPHARYTV
ncbi:DUF6879 family protein [Streptomyces sp. NPDC059385]|uniref:DUF6879 family protein n=1 Tax=Streptomyces sp. NPDC059385 TaxID=3346817 RepID=UPI0036AF1B49